MLGSLLIRSTAAFGLLSLASAASAAAQCTSITGGNTTASAISDCEACTTLYPTRAIDGDTGSSAQVLVAANVSGRNGVRATAQRGIVYPAGSRPGALIKLTQGASVSKDARGILRTLLNGRVQNQQVFDAGALDVNAVGSLSGLPSLKATKPFNAVEVVFDGAYTGYMIEVFELCSDSRVR